MRGRPAENITKKMKYKLEFEDSIWHYNLNKFPNGPYLVEIIDPKFDKLEKLYNKLERLQKPKYHENGRKKRTTKADKNKIKNTEKIFKENDMFSKIDAYVSAYHKIIDDLD